MRKVRPTQAFSISTFMVIISINCFVFIWVLVELSNLYLNVKEEIYGRPPYNDHSIIFSPGFLLIKTL